MMIPTQPEDQPTLDPLMWAVWQLDPTEGNIGIIRIVAGKDTAERIVQTETLLRRSQTGCYQASASSLFAIVQEQSRLEGQTQLMGLIGAIREEVQALRELVLRQAPKEVYLEVPAGESPLPEFASKAPAEVKTNLDCAQPSPDGFLDVPERNRLLDFQPPSKTASQPGFSLHVSEEAAKHIDKLKARLDQPLEAKELVFEPIGKSVPPAEAPRVSCVDGLPVGWWEKTNGR